MLGRRGPADAAFTLPELIGLAAPRRRRRRGRGRGRGDLGQDRDPRRAREPHAGRGASADRPPLPRRSCPDPRRRAGRGLEVSAPRWSTARRADRSRPSRSRPAWCCGRSATGRDRSPACRSTSERALVPNDGGRVEPGLYVGGWIKRGATGFLGTNKSCSKETVERLLDDLDAGLLTAPTTVVEPLRLRGRRQRLARHRPCRARPRRRLREAAREAHRPRRPAGGSGAARAPKDVATHARIKCAHAARAPRSRPRWPAAALGGPQRGAAAARPERGHRPDRGAAARE